MGFSNITVIITALEEELGIKPTLLELQNVLRNSNFLIADGGSQDKTVSIAQNLGATTFIQKGKGKGNAIRQSLKRVDKHSNYVVFYRCGLYLSCFTAKKDDFDIRKKS